MQRFPRVYLSALRLKRTGHWSRKWIVDTRSDLVIEGYPRSANSFLLSAVHLIHGRRLRVATHLHVSSQVEAAVRLGVPTIVMLREPLDAARSLKALGCQCNPERLDSFLKRPLWFFLEEYCRFYGRCREFREGFVIAPFDEVIERITPVFERVNAEFGPLLEARELTEDEKQRVFEEGGKHLSPSPERERIKDWIDAEVSERRTLDWLERARAVYQDLLKGSA